MGGAAARVVILALLTWASPIHAGQQPSSAPHPYAGRSGAAPFALLSYSAGPTPDVRVEFSRPMSRPTVEAAFHIEPGVAGVLTWVDDSAIDFRPASLQAGQTYEVSVDGLTKEHEPLVGARVWTFSTPAPAPAAVTYPFTLTFDDCGTPAQIQAILDALAVRQMPAMFFPTGLCRDEYPWLVPMLEQRGYPVCNHTYSHPVLTRLSNAAIAREIALGVHAGCDFFRPPYGAWDGPKGRIAYIAAAQGYHVMMWDVDTRDWAGTSAADMVAAIRGRGGIVLMHMHGIHTAEAIRDL
jgi:peptidoglycan/xylan/chitin deacetylase (PgdA/CDA1 family)